MALDATQILKFLADGAPERVLGGALSDRFIRDPRSSTRAGRDDLTDLARRLAVEAEAVQAWRQLDLSAVDEVAAARRRLLDAYAAAGEPGDGRSAAVAAGVPQRALDLDDRLLGEVWDALYTAFMTGSGAGPRLDAPVQALRVLHFVASLADEPQPAPARVVELLAITPVVPTVLRDVVGEQRTTASARADVDESPGRSEAVTRLIRERATTQRLLDRVQRARRRPRSRMAPSSSGFRYGAHDAAAAGRADGRRRGGAARPARPARRRVRAGGGAGTARASDRVGHPGVGAAHGQPVRQCAGRT